MTTGQDPSSAAAGDREQVPVPSALADERDVADEAAAQGGEQVPVAAAEGGGRVPDTTRLAAASLAAGDPTGWFERLYAEAGAGTAEVPWDVPEPSRYLAAWARRGGLTGEGRRALVVGCGLGRDAEFLAGLGFAVIAFDISATAVRTARVRHPSSPVDYVVADLLDPPPSWRGGFDLVVESNNVQALPAPERARAIANVGPMVAPSGTLLVIAVAEQGEREGPPWPLTRAEIDAFAGPVAALTPVSVEHLRDPDDPLVARWRAEFRAAG
ncbi:class I SAM-dependent methyltransferase [Actinoplanes sp. NPDC049548]|uniref:class I SAM-dependent methyltransferase n=1 Tax=Actinoplanes sp. NPDC049548 TaxID=3155152 RepID=UPI00341543A5